MTSAFQGENLSEYSSIAEDFTSAADWMKYMNHLLLNGDICSYCIASKHVSMSLGNGQSHCVIDDAALQRVRRSKLQPVSCSWLLVCKREALNQLCLCVLERLSLKALLGCSYFEGVEMLLVSPFAK